MRFNTAVLSRLTMEISNKDRRKKYTALQHYSSSGGGGGGT